MPPEPLSSVVTFAAGEGGRAESVVPALHAKYGGARAASQGKGKGKQKDKAAEEAPSERAARPSRGRGRCSYLEDAGEEEDAHEDEDDLPLSFPRTMLEITRDPAHLRLLAQRTMRVRVWWGGEEAWYAGSARRVLAPKGKEVNVARLKLEVKFDDGDEGVYEALRSAKVGHLLLENERIPEYYDPDVQDALFDRSTGLCTHEPTCGHKVAQNKTEVRAGEGGWC